MFEKKYVSIRDSGFVAFTNLRTLPPPSLSSDLVAATAVAVSFAADAAKEEAPSEY